MGHEEAMRLTDGWLVKTAYAQPGYTRVICPPECEQCRDARRAPVSRAAGAAARHVVTPASQGRGA